MRIFSKGAASSGTLSLSSSSISDFIPPNLFRPAVGRINAPPELLVLCQLDVEFFGHETTSDVSYKFAIIRRGRKDIESDERPDH